MARKKSTQLDPTLQNGIIIILLIVSSIIITLSFFGKAGEFGEVINSFLLAPLFGGLKYIVPLFLLIIVWFLLKENQEEYRQTHGIGLALLVVSTASILNLEFSTSEMWDRALLGEGGGIVGMLAWVFKSYLGNIASWVLLIGLFLTSLLLTFNTSITHFVIAQEKAAEGLGSFGNFIKNSLQNLFVKEDIENTHQTEEELHDYQEFHEDGEDPDQDRDFDTKELSKEKEDETEEEVEIEDNSTRQDIDIDKPDYMKNVVEKKIPPLSLLSSKKQKPSSGDIKKSKKVIQKTMDEFNLNVEMKKVKVGPTVTQFTLRPPSGVKLSKITSLSNNLSLALAAHPIRIEAPIPGKSLVGIEVPNETAAQVRLKELLKSKEFKQRDHDMMIALGKDVAGKVWFADLPKMPHLLIAGATGSGKTVCINTIIMSLIYQNTPETLRFIMVDPKRVELNHYDGIPHLLTPVITKATKAVNALEWLVEEMERRFDVLSEAGNRNITSYNKDHPDDQMPNIVFIIDELADLMQAASNEIEAGTIRLAQMARAVGIHLILATQRPSVDVITGLMKANIPGRISFSVASATDSRVILDEPGAEKLVGKGDMLISTAETSQPKRLQGSFISEKEVSRIIDYLKVDDEPEYDESITESNSSTASMFDDEEEEKDELYEEAKKTVLKAGKGSSSYLQRKLRIGYSRAARILDQLHEEGIVGPPRNSKPREIALSEKEVVQELNPNGAQNVYKDNNENEEETKNKEGFDENKEEEDKQESAKEDKNINKE